MRILQIRFQNLNSLAGEWEIDLTHPDFESNGIFAITGPTGAGKSTVLDAICLALYGRTPRLSRVTKSSNEIMSRQTGECFAEVTFDTLQGSYRCHWSQRRAHRRPDRDLQPPQHEISDAHTGQVLESSLRGVADRVEAVSGMDFDRFTRSMLLAQGGFAAFLQALPDERGPILEQITGTEIYSRISTGVHERRAREQGVLDTLQAELAGMRLLAPDEEASLGERLREHERQAADLAMQSERCAGAIGWLDSLRQLDLEIEQTAQRQAQHDLRLQAFRPERARLEQALRALELEADYTALTVLRQAVGSEQAALQEAAQRVPALQAQRQQAEAAVQAADQALAASRVQHDAALPVLGKVRALDVQIGEKEIPIRAAGSVIGGEAATMETLQARQRADAAVLARCGQELDALQVWQYTHGSDAALERQLAGIEGRLQRLQDGHTHGQARSHEAAQARKRQSEAGEALVHARTQLQTGQLAVQASSDALLQRQGALQKLLDGRELNAWRRERAGLALQGSLLEKTRTHLASLIQSVDELNELSQRAVALAGQSDALALRLQASMAGQQQLEAQQALLRTQLELLRHIASLEDARHQLHDGEACPLCGALDHPYVTHSTPTPDETGQALARVDGELAQARESVMRMAIEQAELTKDRQQVGQVVQTRERQCASDALALSDLIVRLRDTGEAAEPLCAALAQCLAPPAGAADTSQTTTQGRQEYRHGSARDAARLLATLADDNDRAGVAAQHVIDAADAMVGELALLRASLDDARQALAKIEREAQAAQHGQDAASQALLRAQADAQQARDQLLALAGALGQELRPFGMDVPQAQDIDLVRQQLQVRQQAWRTRQQRGLTLEQEKGQAQVRLDERAVQIEATAVRLHQARERKQDLIAARDALLRERQTVFGDNNPDAYEAALLDAVRQAGQAREQAASVQQAQAREVDALQARMQGLQASLAARAGVLARQVPAFAVRLTGAAFSDEAAFAAARLPETQRQALARQAGELDREQAALRSAATEKAARLAQIRAQAVTDQSREALEQRRDTLRADHQAQLLQIGELRGRLQDNERLKQTQQARIQALESQQRECSRWTHLHELIGSADGKKFRNFAQGLTFEMMVAHANRQLQDMTDRYLLVRDAAQPLELNVIDSYQAGEVRSTKNLSGGESFIVSLALALGLSAMASRNVRVDSLFLDEGFGTLDEEALDTALSTLSGLQQAGKLIGVISHVAALKERIGTQIQISPQAGGRSRISGPGCRRLDALTL